MTKRASPSYITHHTVYLGLDQHTNRSVADWKCEANSQAQSAYNNMEIKLVALVVGGSRGIGRQVAIDLASNGYNGVCLRLYYLLFMSLKGSFFSRHSCQKLVGFLKDLSISS